MVTSKSAIAMLCPEPGVARNICDICGFTVIKYNIKECQDGIRRCCRCRKLLSIAIYANGGHRQRINGSFRPRFIDAKSKR
jgi:hypothetical protein